MSALHGAVTEGPDWTYGDKVELVDDTGGQARNETRSGVLSDSRDGVSVADKVDDLVQDVGRLGGQVVALHHESVARHRHVWKQVETYLELEETGETLQSGTGLVGAGHRLGVKVLADLGGRVLPLDGRCDAGAGKGEGSEGLEKHLEGGDGWVCWLNGKLVGVLTSEVCEDRKAGEVISYTLQTSGSHAPSVRINKAASHHTAKMEPIGAFQDRLTLPDDAPPGTLVSSHEHHERGAKAKLCLTGDTAITVVLTCVIRYCSTLGVCLGC